MALDHRDEGYSMVVFLPYDMKDGLLEYRTRSTRGYRNQYRRCVRGGGPGLIHQSMRKPESRMAVKCCHGNSRFARRTSHD